jgi:hypothetical protein
VAFFWYCFGVGPEAVPFSHFMRSIAIILNEGLSQVDKVCQFLKKNFRILDERRK